MKRFLKLQNNKNGMRYARCLIGSETFDGIYKNMLIGVMPDQMREGCEGFMFIQDGGLCSIVRILINKIVLDDFSCMREGVLCKITKKQEDSYLVGTKLDFNNEEDILDYLENTKSSLNENQQLFIDLENLPDGVELSN